MGHLVGPYRQGHERGSFGEVVDLARAVAVTTLLVAVAVVVLHDRVELPPSVPVIGGTGAVVCMLTVRTVLRTWHVRQGSRAVPGDATPIVVVPVWVGIIGAALVILGPVAWGYVKHLHGRRAFIHVPIGRLQAAQRDPEAVSTGDAQTH